MSLLTRIGEKFTDVFKRTMPDAFVFALVLTLLTALSAYLIMGTKPMDIISSWYDGFWNLLTFGMQMVLLIITGYSIALSPIAKRGADGLASIIKTPKQVYYFIVVFGMLMSMVSWSWIVIAAFLARELAERVKGVHYPYLIACVYFSMISWVSGLSSSIPLLLNTDGNYMITGGILEKVIPTSFTLGSTMNFAMIGLFLVLGPLLMFLLAPEDANQKELSDLLDDKNTVDSMTIKEEADSFKFPTPTLSDTLNNSMILQYLIALMGFSYIIYYFNTKGFDLNLNIMIFVFLILGLTLHQTPMRYTISMKRASSNISGILYQFPFYAGIMGIMKGTGLGKELGQVIGQYATAETYPIFAYIIGGVVNFAIPSGGGEFAVIGPSIVEAVNNIGAGASEAELTAMHARASLSIAYGESLTNLLQPFFLLLVIPVMAAGIRIQARDIMGYLVLPFVLFFLIQILMVFLLPV